MVAMPLHLSPFMISILGCSWLPLPPCLASFVSLHDLHFGLLLAAAAGLCPKLVSLHDLHSGLLLAAAAVLSPRLVSLRDLHSALLLAAAALSPKLVFLYDLHSGLLLAAALSPKLVSLHNRICLVPFLFCFFFGNLGG